MGVFLWGIGRQNFLYTKFVCEFIWGEYNGHIMEKQTHQDEVGPVDTLVVEKENIKSLKLGTIEIVLIILLLLSSALSLEMGGMIGIIVSVCYLWSLVGIGTRRKYGSALAIILSSLFLLTVIVELFVFCLSGGSPVGIASNTNFSVTIFSLVFSIVFYGIIVWLSYICYRRISKK